MGHTAYRRIPQIRWLIMVDHHIQPIQAISSRRTEFLDGAPLMSEPALRLEDGTKCAAAQLLQIAVRLPRDIMG